MKKIVFFVESMHCGGAERSLLSLLQNIDRKKYEIDLLVIKKGGEFEKFIPDNIHYKSLDLSFSLSGKSKFFLAKKLKPNTHAAQLFWRVFKNEIPKYGDSYDVAIAWGQGFATYYTATKIKAKRKFAWINIDYNKAGYNFNYDKNIYNKFNKIVGVSDFVKQSMQKYIAEEKVISIRNIIDVDDVKKRAEVEEDEKFEKKVINIVSVGRLAKQKAFDLAIDVAKILKKNGLNFCWFIIGEGEERDNLEEMISKYNLQNNLKLLGFKENPYPYIKNCDIYVQTSLFEGLGRTIIEASILCKPIVTTNFPTAFSILKHNETGVITEMNPNAIAEGVQSLIYNPDLKEKIIINLGRQVDNGKELTLAQIDNLLENI